MIGPVVGEFLRGLVGGLCAPPIFWAVYPPFLLWMRWSLRWLPQGCIGGMVAVVELIALGLVAIGGGASVAAWLAGLAGVPGMPHDPSVYRVSPYRVWPADVWMYVAGMFPGMALSVFIAGLPLLRRPREAWRRLVERLTP